MFIAFSTSNFVHKNLLVLSPDSTKQEPSPKNTELRLENEVLLSHGIDMPEKHKNRTSLGTENKH